MRLSDFDYHLPTEYIAQTPVEPRDHSRLMVLDRSGDSIEHHFFYEISNYLQQGDTLVLNNSRVTPARLIGHKSDSGAKVEVLLLRHLDGERWETLVRPGKKISIGTEIVIENQLSQHSKTVTGTVIERHEGGIRVIRFIGEGHPEKLGKVPLPPYIHATLSNPERYQTIYAKINGSAAAPTAGLHFTQSVLNKLEQKGVQLAFATLHIGLDTFLPVRVDDPQRHHIHKEYGELSWETAGLLNKTKQAGRRIIAVGTTTVRLIEAASQSGITKPFNGFVDLFILPGYQFRVTDAIITNFHLPKSTLLMLVSAFAGREFILRAYEQAREKDYRFYSFGDAMLIL